MPLPAHVDLPDPDLLMRRLRVFAMVDAIVSPEFRSFEFHPRWGRGETMGAFKNGSGDFFIAWCCGRGAVVRGFDHECVMSPFRRDPPTIWPGLLDEFPAALEYALREPAFGDTELTFCFWNTGGGWHEADFRRPAGPDPDGARHVLACLQPAYARWVRTYYGQALLTTPLAAIWRGDALTPALVKALNPDADLTAVRTEAKDLVWPFTPPASSGPRASAAKTKSARAPRKPSPSARKPSHPTRGHARQRQPVPARPTRRR